MAKVTIALVISIMSLLRVVGAGRKRADKLGYNTVVLDSQNNLPRAGERADLTVRGQNSADQPT